jgi:hypothetical protein
MGLGNNSSAIYVDLRNGKVMRYSKTNEPGTMPVVSTKGDTRYYYIYDFIEGHVTNFSTREEEIAGKTRLKFQIHMDDKGESYLVKMDVDSSYFRMFCSVLPNINWSYPVRLIPRMKEENLVKKSSMIVVNNGNPVKFAFTKDNPNGKPEVTFTKNKKGEIVGRALLYMEDNRHDELVLEGIVTVGGFKTSSLTGLVGVFKGRNIRASRDVGVPIIADEDLINWTNNQSKKLQAINLSEEQQLACASHIRHCGGITNNLKIAHHQDGMLNYVELVDKIRSLNTNLLYLVQDAAISIYKRENKNNITFNDNVIWVEKGFVGIFQAGNIDTFIWWPNVNMHDETEYTGNLSGFVEMALCEVWNCSIVDLNNASLISSDEESFEGIIGKNGTEDIKFDHLNIMKKPK